MKSNRGSWGAFHFVHLWESLRVSPHTQRAVGLCRISADFFVSDKEPSFISSLLPFYPPEVLASGQTEAAAYASLRAE